MSKTSSKERDEFEVAEILRKGTPGYIERFGPLPAKITKVINALQKCRTKELGGHSYQCDSCEYERHAYNSCRNRHCPKCQGLPRARWVQDRIDELLPVSYYHAVFTVPSELNPFALRNKRVFYDILQKSVGATITELSKAPKWLGAETGFINVLHTWGQNMMDHPHIHCIIPDGGVKEGKKWVKGRGDFLFPIKVMSRLFKGKFMDAFKKGVDAGNILFHGSLGQYVEPSVWRQLISGLYQKEWVAYCKPPFANERQVIKYLGGYTHRIAISNHRIISVTDDTVSFRWRSYKDDNQVKVMTVSVTEFIRRFLLHVLPSGFKRIRYYGFLSNRKRKVSLSLCFSWLGKAVKKAPPASEKPDVVALMRRVFNIDLTVCPKCGEGRLRLAYSMGRALGDVYR